MVNTYSSKLIETNRLLVFMGQINKLYLDQQIIFKQ